MTDLENKVVAAADAYYNGNEKISDVEYDSLIQQLREENPNSKLLDTVVGDNLKGVNKKYKLPYTMGTLFKCANENKFREWFDKKDKVSDNLMAELKIDGNGQLLIYKNGKLVQCLSRGDSTEGEDTTANVKQCRNVIDSIPDFTGAIRGEIVMFTSVFNQYFNDMKNPRNAAAGIIKRIDGEDCDKLNFIPYDVFDETSNKYDATEERKLQFLKDSGFKLPENFNVKVDNTPVGREKIITWRDSIANIRNDLDFPIDGIVVKQNTVSREDLMRKTPMNNCAIKFDLVIEQSIVRDIEWNIAGSILAPVAIIDPVDLCGTTVSRASLHNLSVMNKLGIKIGSTVDVKKCGEIIPYIALVEKGAIESIDKPLDEVPLEYFHKVWNMPTTCPICDTQLTITKSGFAVCKNPNCAQKFSHRLRKFFDILDIKGIGEKSLENMQEDSNITVSNLIAASRDSSYIDYLKDYCGEKNGQKVMQQICTNSKKEITLPQFLATFDYQGFDEKKLKDFDGWTVDEFLTQDTSKLIDISGWADKSISKLNSFIKDFGKQIKEESELYTFAKKAAVVKGKLTGIKFCFTGKACMPRPQLEAKAEAAGGECGSSVSKETNYLVCDEASTSSKYLKAQKLGIKIITSDEFLKMI